MVQNYKLVVLGEGGVGKSAITIQFTSSVFAADYDPTIVASPCPPSTLQEEEGLGTRLFAMSEDLGMNFRKVDAYRIDAEIDGEVVGLDILDTAGQEVFSAVRDRYMRDGEGFLLVYSLTERSTFLPMSKISEQIRRVKDTDHSVPMVLVGNKSDIADKREVSYGEGELLARTLKCPFFETSAKLRSNVDECFHELVREIKKVQQERSREANEKPQKGGCCTLL